MNRIVQRICNLNKNIAAFWSKAHGWAPHIAADLLSKSRLDRQVSLSNSLKIWFKNPIQSGAEEGNLILAWANLRSLIEGTLKLFLSVWLKDYLKDINAKRDRKNKIKDPDVLELEEIKVFFKKNKLFDDKWIKYIEKIQQRGNAIHSFRDRNIGNHVEFEACVRQYLDLLHEINNRLPYPDEIYIPRE